ncbi:MAG: AraC family transcriptional regulator [Candidatus Limivicinus sp.]
MARKSAYVDTQNFGLDDLFYVDELTMTKPFPLHHHSFAEIHYIRGGQGQEIINGISYPLTRGSMSLKMPWHSHELIPDAHSPLEISKCSFRMSTLENNGLLQSVSPALAQRYDFCPKVQLPERYHGQVEGVFAAMMEERQCVNPLKEEQMAALFLQLLILFIRNADQTPDAVSAYTANDILRLMNLRYRELDLTCRKIAQAVHYSESQVSRLLEDQFGLTFGELLREIRIRNACGLLKTTDYPVESIGRWAGYTSRDGFHTAFLEDKGITPADYRNRYSVFREKENIRILSSGQLYAKIIYYLHRHYAEPVTLTDVATRFRYSESYLKRVLKEQGTSFPKLLEEIRIYHARQLLLETEQTVEGIAMNVGFASPETFYRAFRKHAGLSPAEFRRSAETHAEITDKI